MFVAQQEAKPVATDWDSFARDAEDKGLSDESLGILRKVYDASKSLQAEIAWGRGSVLGSLSPKFSALSRRVAPFSVYGNGRLELHFPPFQKTEIGNTFAKAFATKLEGGGLLTPEYLLPSVSEDPFYAKLLELKTQYPEELSRVIEYAWSRS